MRHFQDITEGSDFADVEFAYSNWQVLEEYEDGQTYPSRQFVYGVYIDEPLVMDVNADASGSGNASCIGGEDARFFYHAGQIYSVAAMSDASGVIVEGWRYDPYGRHVLLADGDADGAVEFDGTDLRATLTASALGNPYTFTGRRFDPETQLHHYRNRYYDSRRGRFISRDPIGYQGGINLYGYVNGNPVLLIDPYGLLSDEDASNLKSISNSTEALEHYCTGGGASVQLSGGASAVQINIKPSYFGKVKEEIDKAAKSNKNSDVRITERMVFNTKDDQSKFLGQVTVQLKGDLKITSCGRHWEFEGDYKIFDDKYDFNVGAGRGPLGETLTVAGRLIPGDEYFIAIRGSVGIAESGEVDYTPEPSREGEGYF